MPPRRSNSTKPKPTMMDALKSAPKALAAMASFIWWRVAGWPKPAKRLADNSAIALLAVVGSNPPASVVINEMTTVASVWTGAQFLDGTALKGHAPGLKIAAGNVPNFVDPSTGRMGRHHPGFAQQQPNANDGQLRHACGWGCPGA